MLLVGKKSFAKKDGSGFCYMVGCVCEFSDREKAAGSIGQAVAEKFVDKAVWDSIKPEDIGKEFVFDFGMDMVGRPVIIGLRYSAPPSE